MCYAHIASHLPTLLLVNASSFLTKFKRLLYILTAYHLMFTTYIGYVPHVFHPSVFMSDHPNVYRARVTCDTPWPEVGHETVFVFRGNETYRKSFGLAKVIDCFATTIGKNMLNSHEPPTA